VKRKHFWVEQIVAILKQAEVGVPVADLSGRRESRSRRSIAGRSSTWSGVDRSVAGSVMGERISVE
jgi:hypothetical protein